MKVMVSNLNNQCFGKVNSLDTANFISDLVAREDKQMLSTSTGKKVGISLAPNPSRGPVRAPARANGARAAAFGGGGGAHVKPRFPNATLSRPPSGCL